MSWRKCGLNWKHLLISWSNKAYDRLLEDGLRRTVDYAAA